jgi:hypothetical protein
MLPSNPSTRYISDLTPPPSPVCSDHYFAFYFMTAAFSALQMSGNSDSHLSVPSLFLFFFFNNSKVLRKEF